jgi:hypothetical protein
MQDRKKPEPNQTAADSDATSDETLHDLEEKESEPAAGDTSGETLSPDGSLDQADEVNDTGPM